MKKIFIVDYGLGNIHSAEQSLKKVVKDKKDLATVKVANNANDINDATHIILPGQGAFSSCMEGLKNIPGMIDELNKNILIKKKPFLGICVGMQLLAETSFENGNHKGLGWIEGEIKKIPQKNLKLPHMGWNEITIEKKNSLIRNKKTTNYYFVHSYFLNANMRMTYWQPLTMEQNLLQPYVRIIFMVFNFIQKKAPFLDWSFYLILLIYD